MSDPTGLGTDGSSPPRRPSWREREAASRFPGAFLDPSLEPAGGPDVHSTIYQPDVLLIAPEPDVARDSGRRRRGRQTPQARTRVQALDEVARRLGWTVTEEPLEDPVGSAGGDRRRQAPQAPRLPSAAQTVRARITIAADTDPAQPVRRPDAWRLLGEARRAGITGISLNHVMTVDTLGLTPFTGNPFTGNPFTGNPFTGNPFTGNTGGTGAYALPGMGGRQPVVYTGPAPQRSRRTKGGRRPVVAVFDTGCGVHEWLDDGAMPETEKVDDGVIINALRSYGGTIGIDDPASDPEAHFTLGDPLDGVMDRASGHGTFIAGIVLQACPDVQILPVRVSNSQGVILESDLTAALGQLVDLLDRGKRIDVLNLSFSFYHESPDSASDDGELYSLLARVRARGCVVVCSAGNDATDRPSSPASLHAYSGGPIPASAERGLAPQVTVGALNPSSRSVAMFSNVGDWVDAYIRGVALLSIMPRVFDGGMQADLRYDLYDHRRETLDLDDFGAGFAVWSGTSFAAPLVAGRIAAELAASLMARNGGSATAPRTVEQTVNAVVSAAKAQDHSGTT